MNNPLQTMYKEFGTEFWNDSCHIPDLMEAIKTGASGATSNPNIVSTVYTNDKPRWDPVLQTLLVEHPDASEDELAWLLIERMATDAARLLHPVFEQTEGKRGFLSVQTNPRLYRSSAAMVAHGRQLSRLAPNMAIKVPATEAGITAMEQLSSEGILINATVCFTVAQCVAAADAIERGLKKTNRPMSPYITIMVGRLDDQLRRSAPKDISPTDLQLADWAGIAVFKKAYQIFRDKKYKSKLLVAAYRHPQHWSELIGENIVQTIPVTWWTQFKNSGHVLKRTIDKPVDQEILHSLEKNFPDFKKSYDKNGLAPTEFLKFEPSVYTLTQFLTGYQDLTESIRKLILR